MLWLANIVWVLLWVKLLKGQQIKLCCLFICYISIRLVPWQRRWYGMERARWSYPTILIWSWRCSVVCWMSNGSCATKWAETSTSSWSNKISYSESWIILCTRIFFALMWNQSACILLNNKGKLLSSLKVSSRRFQIDDAWSFFTKNLSYITGISLRLCHNMPWTCLYSKVLDSHSFFVVVLTNTSFFSFQRDWCNRFCFLSFTVNTIQETLIFIM